MLVEVLARPKLVQDGDNKQLDSLPGFFLPVEGVKAVVQPLLVLSGADIINCMRSA